MTPKAEGGSTKNTRRRCVLRERRGRLYRMIKKGFVEAEELEKEDHEERCRPRSH